MIQQEVLPEDLDRALRPECFDDYVGQDELKAKLEISIEAAGQRNEPVDHILLYGPPGLGKTTMANLISKECGSGFRSVVATAIKGMPDLIEILTKAKPRDVVFIDEIHGLSPKVEETLYSAMEDFKLSMKLGNKEIIDYKLNPFCLVGATTAPGKISGPLRDRFGLSYTMVFYSPEELSTIILANANKLGLQASEDAAMNLALRSRGTPRIANKLLRRARDFAQVKNGGVLSNDAADEAMKMEGIDETGVSEQDRQYMEVIYRVYNCGPVGVTAIASTLGQDRTTVEDFIEPFLVRQELVARTKGGRLLTSKGLKYVIGKT